MVADIFELNGWDGYFLGAGAPESELLALVDEKKPDLLCFSLSVYASLPGLVKLLERVRSEFAEVPVFVGGQAFRWGGIDQVTVFSGVRHVSSIFELEQLLKGW
jgi:MerR family transcriptional regulator, light-induced transcriptional regulator